jgi:hypothetical protein
VTIAQRTDRTGSTSIPRLARWLGFAGLIPQVLIAALVMGGPPKVGVVASGLGLSYAALILSFIGGAWWGFAAQAKERVPPWLWLAAVLPSIVAFASLATASVGRSAVPGLLVQSAALITALVIDLALAARELCPPGWLSLRAPLSLGLGALCILIASFAP